MIWGPIHQKIPDIQGLKEKSDFEGLIKVLRHRDINIQWKASEALGALGAEGMDHLLQALNTHNKEMRFGIIEALGEIGDARAIDPLKGQLDDPSNEIRWEAALALGEIGNNAVIPALQAALQEDQDRYVRYGAALSLRKLGWQPHTREEYASLMVGLQEWEEVVDIGERSVNAISIALRDPDRSIRLLAVRTLGEIGSEHAIPAIFRSLKDADEEVRWEAVLAATRCGIPMRYLPRGLSRRPKTAKNPLVAGFLNFMLPGMGYLYLGMWWGVLVFQVDVYATLWVYANTGELIAYNFLFPIYLIIALHAWYIARKMPDL